MLYRVRKIFFLSWTNNMVSVVHFVCLFIHVLTLLWNIRNWAGFVGSPSGTENFSSGKLLSIAYSGLQFAWFGIRKYFFALIRPVRRLLGRKVWDGFALLCSLEHGSLPKISWVYFTHLANSLPFKRPKIFVISLITPMYFLCHTVVLELGRVVFLFHRC